MINWVCICWICYTNFGLLFDCCKLFLRIICKNGMQLIDNDLRVLSIKNRTSYFPIIISSNYILFHIWLNLKNLLEFEYFLLLFTLKWSSNPDRGKICKYGLILELKISGFFRLIAMTSACIFAKLCESKKVFWLSTLVFLSLNVNIKLETVLTCNVAITSSLLSRFLRSGAI